MKEALSELVKPIKDAIILRFSSPLTTSFLISWGLYNYKLIVILFSNNKVSTTFELIEKHVYSDWWSCVGNFIFPLLFALVYLLIYERLSSWVHVTTLERQTKIRDELKQAARESLITVEEKQAIQAEIISLRERHKIEISSYLGKQIELEGIIDTLNSKKSEKSNGYKFDFLEDDLVRVLSSVGVKDVMTFDEISAKNNLQINMVKSHLDQLIRFNLVRRITQNGDVFYSLSDDGYKYIKANSYAPEVKMDE